MKNNEKEPQKLIICQGIPASGKSTWSKQFVLESPLTRVRVNRDDIRRMLGKYWVPQREDLVTTIEWDMVYNSLAAGYSVVLDSTNLNVKYLDQWTSLIDDFAYLEIEFKPFYITLEEALERDRLREDRVGDDVVTNFYNKYNGKF